MQARETVNPHCQEAEGFSLSVLTPDIPTNSPNEARFFPWYNQDHHHSGIALLTPEMLHYGRAGQVIEQRQKVLDEAYARNPERFPHARPKHPPQPTAAWINPPKPANATEPNLH